MEGLHEQIFIRLFNEAYVKCFGTPLSTPLSEPESKLFSGEILEKTGLVIGAKSIKNYSLYIVSNGKENKKENPSNATLDTLARYVLGAPRTDEKHRKESGNAYPYWFMYRNTFKGSEPSSPGYPTILKVAGIALLAVITLLSGYLVLFPLLGKKSSGNFTDSFTNLSDSALHARGWILKAEDSVWWSKRSEKPGYLALYTLIGDNWPLGNHRADIRNLLMRRISSRNFSAEVNLAGFVPGKNWQQAGILLSEDSTFKGRMVRYSLSYNDYFGGYTKWPEIVLQAVCSSESGSGSKPEEITHFPIYSIPPGNEDLIRNNLKRLSLKIEKKGNNFRLLYAAGPDETFAYELAVSRDIDFQPGYIGIFAIQGWADQPVPVAVYFDSFEITGLP